MGCINAKCINDAIAESDNRPINLNSPNKYKDIEEGVWYDKVCSNIIVIDHPLPTIDISDTSVLQYTDKIFKPDASSLGPEGNQWANVKWYSPQQIFSNGFSIYDAYPTANIIRNIEIDDYLLFCFKYIAQNGILSKIILTSNVNPSGRYVVALFINGILSNVNIDDRLPCSLQKIPIFAYNLNANEIWPSLIEKAFAKIYGNYSNVRKGNASDAMKILTGSPTEAISAIDKDIILILSKSISDKSLVYTLSSTNLKGLKHEQMFVISAVFQTTKAILIKLANPFDQVLWYGKWANDDIAWTESLKREVKFKEREPGSFYICLEEFIECFKTINICKIRSEYTVCSTGFSHKQGDFAAIKIAVNEGTHGFIYTSLPCPGINGTPFYDTYIVKLNLWKHLGNDEYAFVSCKTFASGGLMLFGDENIEAGEYIAIFECKWDNSKISTLTFTSYANKPVDFGPITKGFGELLVQLMKGVCLRLQPSYTDVGHLCKIYQYYPIEGVAFGCIYIINTSQTNAVSIQIEFTDSLPIVFPPNVLNQSELEFTVKPSEEKICILYCEVPIESKISGIIKPINDPTLMISERNVFKRYKFPNGDATNIALFVVNQIPSISFVFSNKSTSTTLSATITLELVNLRTKDSSTEFKIMVRPGRTVVIDTVIINKKKEISYHITEQSLLFIDDTAQE